MTKAGSARQDQQPAFVLHHYPFRETSLVIETFTRDFGRVALLARGARRPRSALRGVLLTVDAQWGHSFLAGDVVEITAAATPLVMYASRQSFFDVMRDKLHWGARSDARAKKKDPGR